MESISLRHAISATHPINPIRKNSLTCKIMQSLCGCCKPPKSTERGFLSLRDHESEALYKVKLGTSNAYGSGLSDITAGILVCLIDEKGNSILQRIPSNLQPDDSKEVEDERVQLQRGSVDEFIFKGPKLENVEALWISLESGQWRLGSVKLTVLYGNDMFMEEFDGEKLHYICCDYGFY